MLGFKVWRVQQQRGCLDADLLPSSIAERINADNAHVFTSYLRHASLSLPPNFLSARLERATLFLSSRRSASAVAEQLTRQSDADANALDSSYTTLRVFIWAIPILGFIGTVLGIGTAVAAFSDTVSSAVDLDVMKESIGSVATGLGVAFDTTLLALVTSIVLMFPMSWLQKFEESLLARVDDYCDSELAGRLEELPGEASAEAASADADLGALSATVGSSLRALDDELGRLSKSVGSLRGRLDERERG
jgi:biopolymer transport protein ExbB/TolQ